uniref:Choline transport protein n=1 Tax=Bionectria ochroleuca TaxID=29856 RepID=A0A8H7KC45_BIOOC
MASQNGQQEGHLQKRFSKITMVGMSFAILNTWISLAGSIGLIMPSGGSVSFVYGFLFCIICSLCLAASLGELASRWPTAGGQYHYAYALASEKWRKSMSFLVGWINIAGWLTLNTTAAYFGARFLAAAAVAGSHYTYEITKWGTYLMFVAVSIIGVLLNLFAYPILNRWNEGALYWSVTSVVVISIVLLATSPKTDAAFVFTNFSNTTGWSDGTAWMLGLLQSALSFVGSVRSTITDRNASAYKGCSQAMVASIMVGGVTGIVFILVMLFCAVDIDGLLASATQSPLTEMIQQATGSYVASTVLTVAVALLSHLHPKLNVPVRAILVQAVFNLLFGLIYLGPEVAFNAYISSCTLFLNLSYAAPVIILLTRGRKIIMDEPPSFPLAESGFFCFPPAIPVDASSMNYVVAVVGIFIIFVTGLWLFKRNAYQGPNIELILGEALPVIHADMADPHSKTSEDTREKSSD